MTQHTPGPWNLEPMRSPTGNMLITNGRRETVALLRDSLQDDARLIAAAPELLTSLTECLAALDQLHREGLREYHPIADASRAAIARATGASPSAPPDPDHA